MSPQPSQTWVSSHTPVTTARGHPRPQLVQGDNLPPSSPRAPHQGLHPSTCLLVGSCDTLPPSLPLAQGWLSNSPHAQGVGVPFWRSPTKP